MRDDLLHAQASIDWPVSQFPSLRKRIDTWLAANVNMVTEDAPAPALQDLLVVIVRKPFPLAFNVEVGAYINSIRSSLDILATALAIRYRVPKPQNAYFPIVDSAATFLAGRYKGSDLVKGLPSPVRVILETLKPYKGGHETLWPLHQLDIMRKHQRLVNVAAGPRRLGVTGFGVVRDDFELIAGNWAPINDKTTLGLLRKGAPHYELKFTPQVTFTEISVLPNWPIMRALDRFATSASEIINLFDY